MSTENHFNPPRGTLLTKPALALHNVCPGSGVRPLFAFGKSGLTQYCPVKLSPSRKNINAGMGYLSEYFGADLNLKTGKV
jgi:hypothetical protein